MDKFQLIVYGTEQGSAQAAEIRKAVEKETPAWERATGGTAQIFTGKEGNVDKVLILIPIKVNPVPNIQWNDPLLKETIRSNITIVMVK